MATRQEITNLKNRIRWKYRGVSSPGDYTDADYALVITSDFVGDSRLGSYNKIITWQQAFHKNASVEFLSDLDNITPNKIAYYNSQKGRFSEQEQREIEASLVLAGNADQIVGGIGPESLMVSKEEFVNRATEAINVEIVKSAQVKMPSGPNVLPEDQFIILRRGNYYYFGEGKPWGSKERLAVQVYQNFSATALPDNPNYKVSDLTWKGVAKIAEGEADQILNIANIRQVNPESLVTPEKHIENKYEAYLTKFIDWQALTPEERQEQQQELEDIANEKIQELVEALLPLARLSYVVKRRRDIFERLSAFLPTATVFDAEKALADAQATANRLMQGFDDGASDTEVEIDVAARQKVFEQCALLSDLANISNKYRRRMAGKSYGKNIFLLETTKDDPSSIMNKLLLPKKKDIDTFLNITPDIVSMLVPKIRLFLVNSSEEKKEFMFPKSTAPGITNIFRGDPTAKGTEFGIKSFSFSFEGTNPATARNDIVAKLSLFFQNFNDFVTDQYDPKFVDLILYDNPTSRNEYKPENYRILAEVGWQIPKDPKIINEINKRKGQSYDSLKNALRKVNKSFYLNMVEHEMNFKDDGSFEVNIQYRAYIESALKSPQYDALSTPEIIIRKMVRQRQYDQLIASDFCDAKGLQKLARAFEAEDAELIKDAYRSIIQRLLCKGKIFMAKPSEADINRFSRLGYFTSPCNWVGDPLGTTDTASANLLQEAQSVQKQTVNYFFFGDLIDTIMDSANELEFFENCGVILFPFQIQNFEGTEDVLNIAELPISVDFFIEWYAKNVTSVERKSYPIMNFIRDITNDLIIDLMSEQCRHKPLDSKIRFDTSTVIIKKAKDAEDPISAMTFQGTRGLDVFSEYSAGELPLDSDHEEDSRFSKYHNYFIIYPIYNTITHKGRGNLNDDSERGTYHFDIGADRGLLKKVKFSKVDMQYIREARFFHQGTQDLNQLAAVYKASMEMIGNTLYYPGMELYINPRGLGLQGSPSEQGTIANMLGFGGYHLVTRVNSNITPSTYNTTVEAMFTYSGDGTPSIINPAISKELRDKKNLADKQPVKVDPGNCKTAIIAAEGNVLDLFTDKVTRYGNLQSLFQLTPEQKEAVQAEIDEGFQSGVPTDDSEIEGNVEFIEEEFELYEQFEFFDGDPTAGEEFDTDDELEMPDPDAGGGDPWADSKYVDWDSMTDEEIAAIEARAAETQRRNIEAAERAAYNEQMTADYKVDENGLYIGWQGAAYRDEDPPGE